MRGTVSMAALKIYESLSIESLEKFVEIQQEEHLHLDFKTLRDSKLSGDDRRNFAKAVSGFSNSDGGVIIWGVDARKSAAGVDCARALKPIESLASLISGLNDFTGEAVSPTVDGIIHKKIPQDGDKGFAATLVPASDAGPYMARGRENRYYKRSGDSFYQMEHYDIADMFGKRRRPTLEIASRVARGTITSSGGVKKYQIRITLGISNTGRGSAVAPFIAISPQSPYKLDQDGIDGNGNHGLARLLSAERTWIKFGGLAHVVIHPGTTLDVTTITGEVIIPGPTAPALVLPYQIAAEDVPLRREILELDSARISLDVVGP